MGRSQTCRLLGIRCERRQRRIVGAVVKKYLHTLFRLLQFLLALTRQLYAAFELVQRVFQRQFARLQTRHDAFQLAEGAFKAGSLLCTG